jgi:hypothetical protein
MRTHFTIKNQRPICGRGKRVTDNISRVDCRLCLARPETVEFMAKAAAEKTAAFLAQEPRRYAEPWKPGDIICSECGHNLFRYAGRSCMGHYSEHVCAKCGHSESRLTETGMSF